MSKNRDNLSALFSAMEDERHNIEGRYASRAEMFFRSAIIRWKRQYAPSWTMRFYTGMGVGNVDLTKGPAKHQWYFMPAPYTGNLGVDMRRNFRGPDCIGDMWPLDERHRQACLGELRALLCDFGEYPHWWCHWEDFTVEPTAK